MTFLFVSEDFLEKHFLKATKQKSSKPAQVAVWNYFLLHITVFWAQLWTDFLFNSQ